MYFEKVYLPIKPPCDLPSRAVWQQFRSHLFDTRLPAILKTPVAREVSKLKIVLTEEGSDPDWVNSLAQQLRDHYNKGEAEVVVYHHNMSQPVEIALKTFSTTSILVGTHGEPLVNLVFLPDNAVVLEILPEEIGSFKFGQLAAAAALDYHFMIAPVSTEIVAGKIKGLSAKYFPSG